MTSLLRTSIPENTMVNRMSYYDLAAASPPGRSLFNPACIIGKVIEKIGGGADVPFTSLSMTDGTEFQLQPQGYDPAVSDSVVFLELASNEHFRDVENRLNCDGPYRSYFQDPPSPVRIEDASYLKITNDHGEEVTALGLKVQGKWGLFGGQRTVMGQASQNVVSMSSRYPLALLVEKGREGGQRWLTDEMA